MGIAFGQSPELAIPQQHVVESRGARRKKPEGKFAKGKSAGGGGRVSRRQFLIGGGLLGAAGLLTAAGVVLGKKPEAPVTPPSIDLNPTDVARAEQAKSENGIYAGWEKYVDATFPPELVMAIAEDLISSPLTGFAEAGELLKQSQLSYASIPDFYPPMSEPLQIGMSELMQTFDAVGQFSHFIDRGERQVQVRDIAYGQDVTIGMVYPKSSLSRVNIGLENDAQFGSAELKRIILAKEISHFKYINMLRQAVATQVREYVTFPPEVTDADILLNAFFLGDPANTSGVGYFFDNARRIWDGAGFFHVLIGFGEALRQGKFTEYDLVGISAAKVMFTEALNKDLLIEVPGTFKWKEGITPLSPEWMDIVGIFM